MTTSTAPLPLESLATFAQFAQAAASSSAGVVLFASFDAPPAQPLPGTQSFDDFVSELEADPELAAELAASRQELSAALYPDAQESLAAMRLAAGLSQSQLAAIVETSQSHIARMEAGRNDPSTGLISRIADALKVDPARLFRAVRRQLDAARGH